MDIIWFSLLGCGGFSVNCFRAGETIVSDPHGTRSQVAHIRAARVRRERGAHKQKDVMSMFYIEPYNPVSD